MRVPRGTGLQAIPEVWLNALIDVKMDELKWPSLGRKNERG
jgi:hypothetical protein